MSERESKGAGLTCLPRLAHTCRAAGLSVTHTKAIKRDSRSVWHCPVPASKCQSREAWHSLCKPGLLSQARATIPLPGSHPSPSILLREVQRVETGPPCQRLKYPHHLEGSVATAVTPCMCMLCLKQRISKLKRYTPFPTCNCCLPHLRTESQLRERPSKSRDMLLHAGPLHRISAWLKAALPPEVQDSV